MATTAKDELAYELAELVAYALNTGSPSLVEKVKKIAVLAGFANLEASHAAHIDRFRAGDERRH